MKREIVVKNIFGVDFVHCAEWLKQAEKELDSVGEALSRIYNIEDIDWGVVRNLLTLPWIIMLINWLVIALVKSLVS